MNRNGRTFGAKGKRERERDEEEEEEEEGGSREGEREKLMLRSARGVIDVRTTKRGAL